MKGKRSTQPHMTCPELLRQKLVSGPFHEQRVGVNKGSCPGHDAEKPTGMFQVARTLTAVGCRKMASWPRMVRWERGIRQMHGPKKTREEKKPRGRGMGQSPCESVGASDKLSRALGRHGTCPELQLPYQSKYQCLPLHAHLKLPLKFLLSPHLHIFTPHFTSSFHFIFGFIFFFLEVH